MKLSNVLFWASILMLSITGLILFAGNPADPIWGQALFSGFFATVFCSVAGAAVDAAGH